RRVAALSLRSAADSEGRSAAAPRLRSAQGEGRRLHAQRIALPDGRAGRSGALQEVRRAVSGCRRTSIRCLSATRGHQSARLRGGCPAGASRWQGAVMDLSTTYLGTRLPNPFVIGAGPLTDDLDMAKSLEDAGAAMLVLRSLFEEEITGEQMDAFFYLDGH